MELVKVKTKYQITLPVALRKKAGVNIGDIFEATVNKGEITLRAKNLVDKGIAEGLADVRAGRVYGPFDTHKEMVDFLHESVKKYKKSKHVRK
ncbi:MAG: AbrB/MazE/SpoVT family DNA-binding domain-containing protein [Candidatus Doudnabacteria bacterium]|nr:AbrB/MazE/SpoVT family DNA-binding domain-containing protein [Candidatus Doudnabacteria bacterium]